MRGRNISHPTNLAGPVEVSVISARQRKIGPIEEEVASGRTSGLL